MHTIKIKHLLVTLCFFLLMGCTSSQQDQPETAQATQQAVSQSQSPLSVDSYQAITAVALKDISKMDRTHALVRGGVPMAKGVLKNTDALVLLDENRQLQPMTARAQARWDDGSIKWLLIDTLADLPANSQREWTLGVLKSKAAIAGRAAQKKQLLATATDGSIHINTGKLSITFQKQAGDSSSLWQIKTINDDGTTITPSGNADSVLTLQSTPPGEPDILANWLRDAADAPAETFTATADKKRTAVIEENSPQQAIIRLNGWHVNAAGRRVYPYIMRIEAHRNSARLHVTYTFTVTEEVKTNFLRSLVVTAPGVQSPDAAVVGLPQNKSQTLAFDNVKQKLSVRNIGTPRHYDNVSYKKANPVSATVSTRDGQGNWTENAAGVNAPGWAAVYGKTGSAFVGFRDFGRMHPKELAVDGQGELHVYLWPARGNMCLDLRRRSDELRPEFVENGADPHAGRGVAVTHEWQLGYAASAVDDSAIKTLTTLAAQSASDVTWPLRPISPPAYVAATGAFGEFLPAGTPGFEHLDAALAFSVKYLHAIRSAFELDGMMDWGDVPIAGVGAVNHIGKSNPEGLVFQGYNGWLNNDWGLAHGLFLHALRTGDPQALLDAENMTRHVMDVDTIHYYPENPEFVGHGRRHDQQHWGNGPRGYCFAPYATIDHLLITGENRAYDVAKLMADHPAGYGRYSTIRFWEIAGDKQYLQKAQDFLKTDLAGNADGWPFLYGQNFRSNSYDGIGYTFYDNIAPNAKLTAAAVKALNDKKVEWLTPWMNAGHPTQLLAAMAHRAQPTEENTRVLQAMVWNVAVGKIPADANIFNLPADASFESYLEVNRKTMQIGRTDMLGLYYLLGLPRVMARLNAAGVNESACIDMDWQWRDQPSFTEVFDAKKIRRSAELPSGEPRPGFLHEYDYYTKNNSPGYRPDARYGKEMVAKWEAASRRTRMYEDGVLIGPHPWPRSLMRTQGELGWTRRLSGAAVFCSTDNSDPRTNGRVYSLKYTSAADEKWQDVPSFDVVVDKAGIKPFGSTGKAWYFRVKQPMVQQVAVYPSRKEDDQRWQASLKRYTFTIDGKDQGAMYDQESWPMFWKARVDGWGRDEAIIMFVQPEGVDPRTDGKRYELKYTNQADAQKSADKKVTKE